MSTPSGWDGVSNLLSGEIRAVETRAPTWARHSDLWGRKAHVSSAACAGPSEQDARPRNKLKGQRALAGRKKVSFGHLVCKDNQKHTHTTQHNRDSKTLCCG